VLESKPSKKLEEVASQLRKPAFLIKKYFLKLQCRSFCTGMLIGIKRILFLVLNCDEVKRMGGEELYLSHT
jgi:hypothetical protein